MKTFIATALLALPLAASAQNLLTNGSFESGLAGWTAFGPGSAFLPTLIPTGATSTQFNTFVPLNTTPVLNPNTDAPGSNAVYFVDDSVSQTLFQTLPSVAPGTYLVGFDFFLPENARVNPANSSLTVSFGSTFASLLIGVGGGWQNIATTVTLTGNPNAVTFSFGFVPTGSVLPPPVFGKDIVIDRAYVIPVPEPTTYALFGAGLLAIGFLAHRRKQQS